MYYAKHDDTISSFHMNYHTEDMGCISFRKQAQVMHLYLKYMKKNISEHAKNMSEKKDKSVMKLLVKLYFSLFYRCSYLIFININVAACIQECTVSQKSYLPTGIEA